jgi:hypothetical protein
LPNACRKRQRPCVSVHRLDILNRGDPLPRRIFNSSFDQARDIEEADPVIQKLGNSNLIRRIQRNHGRSAGF